MTHSWDDPETQDLWRLSTEESALLPGMTDKGRLGFAIQLKFMQLHGRFPEHYGDIDPDAVQWLAGQLGTTTETLSSYEFSGRQGQRHQRTIRVFLDYRPATGNDLKQLNQWLCDEVLPFDPQARHGLDVALEWFNAQRLEPPALSELDRAIRSAVHGFETHLQETIHARLSAASKAAIDQLLAGEEPGNDDQGSTASASIFAQLKADLGKSSRDNLLLGIERRQAIDAIDLVADMFKGIPPKFIDQFRRNR